MWRAAPVTSAAEMRRRHETGWGAAWSWCEVVEAVRFFFDTVEVLLSGRARRRPVRGVGRCSAAARRGPGGVVWAAVLIVAAR
ncbi:hypothetical protein GCM10010345_92110 [Streptomyces canarius]|uniref:Transposase n=1 Tax=Streptomyces canarius TaxID=285453 RepID=A0ABQ3DCR2_9ACTN|nr:hypothetical protein GCM10010345_92110 [Streptomyces canarius]